MTGHQIRQQFLDYFARHGHRVVKSASLVPAGDPTLLFTNAGMNQFKDVFLGQEVREYTRAASSQKCVRAGGKHNDLENVGYTRRHHTFFEMLGNFSFGDYFKREAIELAWELITGVYGVPKDRLYITVFREDDEAEQLWQQVAGVDASRIFRLDEKDNFWQMGDTGPCGPCSEIHYDLGADAAAVGREHEAFPLDGGGRFVEIWNLVFMQFDRDQKGVLTPLPRPSIDTGMGLERLAAILQGKLSNYECDLIRPIIEFAAGTYGIEPGADAKADTALRILADHARATAFLIHDGVVPSNEGRGYVLRKIMRRALRNLRLVGVDDPRLERITSFVAEFMQPAYPELSDSVGRVSRVVREEERRYATTFQVAERVFQDEARGASGGVLPGAAAFKLYDTYGLALDEQEEMAREAGLTVDREGYEAEMTRQRERARASWKGAEKAHVAPAYASLAALGRTEFLGYERLQADDCRVVGLLREQAAVESLDAGVAAELVLERTPFYAEAGGQTGDRGVLRDAATGAVMARVLSVYAPIRGLSVHRIETVLPLSVGVLLRAEVDAVSRWATMRNHTATHLLHAALRSVLGPHVKQAGSVVEADRLRFDFTHYASLEPDELAQIEQLMNEQVLRNEPLQTDVLELEQALATGAMALFGEKYGDRVRVVRIGGFSKELCGGTHVGRTGDIGLCKVLSEGSISAGVRRIEAVSGEGALRRFQETSQNLARVAQLARTSEPEAVEAVDKLLHQQRTLEKQNDALKQKVAAAEAVTLAGQAHQIGGVHVVAARVEQFDRPQLRLLADSLRNKWPSAVVVLASVDEGNVSIVAAVSKALSSKVHAGKLVGFVAAQIGGKGGGRPDLAEAGGKDSPELAVALDQVVAQVEAML